MISFSSAAVRWWCGGITAAFIAPLAVGKAPPDWLKPLIAQDVSALGRGHVAVRLLDSSDVRPMPDHRVKRVNRGAVRVLTDLGRQRAICAYQFNADTERVVSARAWIASPDGKNAEVFTLKDFSDTALKIGSVFWPQQRVLSYRATTQFPIGSIFAWEFEVESQTGHAELSWVFRTDLPTWLSVLEVTPAAGGKLVWHAPHDQIPEPVAGTLPGALRWEKRNYSSIVIPSDRPPGFLAAPRVLSIRELSPNNVGAISSWANLARLAAGIIEPRIVTTAELKTKAEGLI